MSQPAAADRPGLQVVGVGFGRTGTLSLRAALVRLGYGPCYHGWEVVYDAARARQWLRVAQGEHPQWTEMFEGYRATVDWPGAAYWRELVDEYPDAKVVLTVRDPHRWYESARNTIFRFPLRRHNAVQRLGFTILSKINPAASAVIVMFDRVLWDRVFGGRAFDGREGDREFAVTAFYRHVDEVKAYLPAERLLVFEVAEGWEPLCGFLGVPVPDEAFPRLNETEDFNRMLADRRRVATRPVAAVGAIVALAGITGLGVAAVVGANVAAAVGAAVVGVGAVAVGIAAIGERADRWRARPGTSGAEQAE